MMLLEHQKKFENVKGDAEKMAESMQIDVLRDVKFSEKSSRKNKRQDYVKHCFF